MPEYTDQMEREVLLPHLPKRIVSLVPSQTELLYDLGLNSEVVGITRYCTEPSSWLNEKVQIGGTKKFYFDRIEELKPDLIIGNHEENYREGIERLQASYPVWMSDIYSVEDSLKMINSIGELTGKREQAVEICLRISAEFNSFQRPAPKRAAYFIWKNPYMIAAGNTFINHMLAVAGFENVFADVERYPEVSLQQLVEAKPEVLLLSSEPFPFAEKDCIELKGLLPDAHPIVVDGMAFSWYGSRLLSSPAYFTDLQKSIANERA
ncbi:MAG: ABC transporter substrate-binding protein [Calditrichia bacterium]